MPKRFKSLERFICSFTDERAGQLYKMWVEWCDDNSKYLPRELQQFVDISNTRAEASKKRWEKKTNNTNI